jgi:hypothetical protein
VDVGAAPQQVELVLDTVRCSALVVLAVQPSASRDSKLDDADVDDDLDIDVDIDQSHPAFLTIAKFDNLLRLRPLLFALLFGM